MFFCVYFSRLVKIVRFTMTLREHTDRNAIVYDEFRARANPITVHQRASDVRWMRTGTCKTGTKNKIRYCTKCSR
jgi:hypothetical protein